MWAEHPVRYQAPARTTKRRGVYSLCAAFATLALTICYLSLPDTRPQAQLGSLRSRNDVPVAPVGLHSGVPEGRVRSERIVESPENPRSHGTVVSSAVRHNEAQRSPTRSDASLDSHTVPRVTETHSEAERSIKTRNAPATGVSSATGYAPITPPAPVSVSYPGIQEDITTDALHRATAQLERMLEHMPNMARPPGGVRISERDSIYQWAVRQFAGESGARPIYWSSDPPLRDGLMSDHYRTPDDGETWIRIRDVYQTGSKAGELRAFEELWKSLAYQLISCRRDDDYSQIHELALSGEMNRDTWIRLNTQIDYETSSRVVEFYRQVWDRWARTQGLTPNSLLWGSNLPDSYDAWFAQYKDVSGYPWSTWGDYYDRRLASRFRGY